MAEPDAAAVHVEYIPLENLVKWPRNPKTHDLGQLHESVRRFGFVAPVLVDENTGRIVAGHGRIDVLQQLKDLRQAPPKHIQVDGDSWLVPVVRGISFKDTVEAESYIVADNRLVEIGGWDEARLANILTSLVDADALTGVGYDLEDVDDLLAKLQAPIFDPNLQPDIGGFHIAPEDIERARGTIKDKFRMKDQLTDIICPYCQKEFALPSDLLA